MTTEKYGAVALTKSMVEAIETLINFEISRCQKEIVTQVNAGKLHQARQAEEQGKFYRRILQRLTLFVPIE
jgi:hypothetical protein